MTRNSIVVPSGLVVNIGEIHLKHVIIVAPNTTIGIEPWQ
jgi:hypothetical protein